MACNAKGDINQHRRRILSALATGLAGAALPHGVGAQVSRSALRIVYPYSPGGEWDSLVRVISSRMSQLLNLPALVENRPGGSGRVGVNYLLSLDPNAHNVIFLPTSPIVFAPIVQPHNDFDVQRDLVPIAQIATFESCCAVNASLGINNISQFIDWVRKNPGKANCGLSGSGGLHHFISIALQKALNVQFQYVFYKGGGQLRNDLLANHVPFSFGTAPEMVGMHRAGKIKVIATSGSTRMKMLPEVPTYREQGHDLVAQGWYGMFASAKTPPAVLKSLEEVSLKAARDKEAQQTIIKMGSTPAVLGAEGMGKTLKTDIERWGPIIKASGFTVER